MQPNNPLEILENLKQLILTKREKEKMRTVLISHMQPTKPMKPLGFLSAFANLFAKPLALALVVILMITGGVAIAAENALPGDTLYPIKVNVNEEMRSAVLASFDAEASWEVIRAERRLEEAEQLLSEDRLNTQTALEIKTNFEAQAKIVEQVLADVDDEKIEDKDKRLKIRGNYQASLQAHENILKHLKIENQNRAEVKGSINDDNNNNGTGGGEDETNPPGRGGLLNKLRNPTD